MYFLNALLKRIKCFFYEKNFCLAQWSMDLVMPLQVSSWGNLKSFMTGHLIYYSLNKSFCQVDK